MPILKKNCLPITMEEEKDFYNIKAKELFGINYIYPWQRLVIANTLEALGYFGEERKEEAPKKTLVILPTGAGKSLCYMMPGFMSEGITLILFPLLALMADQERRLKELGAVPLVFRGGQSRGERQKLWERARGKGSLFILTNPETAGQNSFQRELARLPLKHLVIDEVHTVAQWGESFRSGLLNTGMLVKSGMFPLVTAFTATAPSEYQEKLGRLVFDSEPFHAVLANPDRPNISYYVNETLCPWTALEELCQKEEKPLLVFCATRASAEESARFLQRKLKGRYGVGDVKFYHAGLDREEKKDVENWFMDSTTGILTATTAYGMGMDKENLSTVIHKDIPHSVESYIQEAGRAGRSGNSARAIMLYDISLPGIANPMETFAADRSTCRRKRLMEALGHDSEYCGGCDFCTPRNFIPRTSKEENDIRRLSKRYSSLFNLGELTRFLKGYAFDNPYNALLPGFGTLHDWDSEIIMGTLKKLIKKKKRIIGKSKK